MLLDSRLDRRFPAQADIREAQTASLAFEMTASPLTLRWTIFFYRIRDKSSRCEDSVRFDSSRTSKEEASKDLSGCSPDNLPDSRRRMVVLDCRYY